MTTDQSATSRSDDLWPVNRQVITVDDLVVGCCFGSGDCSDIVWRIKWISKEDRKLIAECIAHHDRKHVGDEWHPAIVEFLRWAHHRVRVRPARNHRGEAELRFDVCS